MTLPKLPSPGLVVRPARLPQGRARAIDKKTLQPVYRKVFAGVGVDAAEEVPRTGIERARQRIQEGEGKTASNEETLNFHTYASF